MVDTPADLTPEDAVSRRSFVVGAVGAGAALPLVAACGSGGSGVSGGSGGSGSSGAGGSSGASSSGGGSTTVPASQVPVGGGKIFAADKVVVSQPTAGQFKAFSAVCTHQGCLVSKIEGKKIVCECHGSAYSLDTGSVLNGPATQPLNAIPATETGSSVKIG